MSIFDQNLDKGGVVGDVARVVAFTYANGKRINYNEPYYSRDTIRNNPAYQDVYEGNDFVPSLHEIDIFSNWPIMSDGFLCNLGNIKYSQIFGENLHYLDSLPDIALKGPMEKLFVPFFAGPRVTSWGALRDTTIFGSEEEYIDAARLVEYTKWWDMVGAGIKVGIENAIDPKVHAQVFVTSYQPWVSDIDNSFYGRFYITFKIYSHKDMGDIFWPYNDPDEYNRPGQLFGIDQGTWNDNSWRGYCHNPVVGTPVSITTKLELIHNKTK